MRFNTSIIYSVITTLIVQLNVLTISAAATGVSAIYNNAYAQEVIVATPSNTQRLDNLRTKYDLDNVNRNHQNTGHIPASVESQLNLPSRDLSGILTEQINNSGPSRAIDLTGQSMGDSIEGVVQNSNNDAKLIGQTHGTPSFTNDGSLNSSYSVAPTRQFKRDENNNLISVSVDGVDRVDGINDKDLYGIEAQNEESVFNADQSYGNEEGFLLEGNRTHLSLKDGKSATARGFQAVTSSAQRGINTNIDENEGWLQPSFNSLDDVQNSGGDYFSSCQTITKENTTTIQSPATEEFSCQDIEQANYDFCEVERDIKIPVYASSPGMRSCGVGCYEFDMNINAKKNRWKCRRTESGHGVAAKFTLNLNMSEPIRIKSITVVGEATDHFRYELNDESLWQNTGGNQNFTGDYLSGSCNRNGHDIYADVTSRANQIIGTLPTSGMAALNFKADLRWRGGGNMSSVIRVEIETTDDSELVSEFKQFPQGCYDALKLEDKEERPLLGMYNWQEIGVDGAGGARENYNCTRAPAQPVCKAGEQLFGNITQEQCLSTPSCPANTLEACNALGYKAGTFTHKPPVCPVGTITSDGNNCEYDAVNNSGALSCPQGGTINGLVCSIGSVSVSSCGDGLTLESKIIDGVQTNYCTRSPTEHTNSNWQCGGGKAFSSSYCVVTPEDYLDPDDKLYVTLSPSGVSLLPLILKNEDGIFEEVEFEDYATCSKPIGEVELPIDVEIPASFCTFDNYQTIVESTKGYEETILGLIPQWYTGDVGNKSWKVNLAGYQCDPTNGQILEFLDPETGELKNYNWKDIQELPQQCQRYMDDPECREVERECTEGWLEEQTGRCMADTVTFKCDRGKELGFTTVETTNTCDGILPCSGGECFNSENESNGKFIESMVAGSIIDNIDSDSSCTDPNDPSTCRIFEGEYKYCSWETTGLGTDCCEQPKGLDILAYIAFARTTQQVTQMAGSGAFGSTVQGAYSTLSKPITDAGQAIANWASSPFSSTTNSLIGSQEVVADGVVTSLGGTAGESAIAAALHKVQQQVYQFVSDMLPDALADMVFQSAGDAGTAQAADLVLNDSLKSAFSGIMAIYTAYQMIKLALILLSACDDVEMDMGIRLAQRSCFKVGNKYCEKKYPLIGVCMLERQDYCCYSSILSRIIMKESYSQLGIDPLEHGKPTKAEILNGESNACMGLTAPQLANVDFAKPSMQNALQEWVGLLLDSGEILTESSEQILTGGASKEDVSCQKIMNPKIDPITSLQVRDINGELVWIDTGEEDCFQRADGGQIYNAEGRKTTGSRTIENVGTAQERVQEGKNYMKDAANNLDCSIYPRPPVCNFMINMD